MQGQLSVYARGSEDDPAVTPPRPSLRDGPTDIAAHAGQTVRLTLLMAAGWTPYATRLG
jgi:hypothetical protein